MELERVSPVVAAFRDAFTVTQRNLIALRRVPQALIFATIQPVMFVLLFVYVFGGAIQAPAGGSYVNYLIPGVFVQAVVFGAVGTAVGLAADLQTGLLERFRSLPMARSAVLTGRTFADLARNLFVVTLMGVVGFLVGFRIETNFASYLLGMMLVLGLGYALSWVFATVGLLVGDPEAAQAAAFPVMAPLVFASSAFVPVETMPSWLQGFATYQPVSVVATATRALMIGPVFAGLPADASTAAWSLGALAWIVGIVLVAAPLAVRKYRRTV